MTNLSKLLAQLQDNQSLKVTPKGTSMCPCFMGGRDTVYVKRPRYPLRRGDIALFFRDSGIYVIHRVSKVKSSGFENFYYMSGDNQNWIEGPIREEQIHGVTTHILRKGKLIDCQKNLIYRFYAWSWLFLHPVRLCMLVPYRKIKNFLHIDK